MGTRRIISLRPPALVGAVLLASLVLVFGGVVLLSAAGGSADAAPQERAEYVPFLGSFRMSCTWGRPSGVRSLCSGGSYHPNAALDIQLPSNTTVTAAGAGEVTKAAFDKGFGNFVLIYHRGDDRTSLYAHLTSFSVKASDRVLAGQPIGLSGHTGNVQPGPGGDGSHLHYAEAKGRLTTPPWSNAVDPGKMLGTKNGRPASYPDAMGSGDWTRFNIEPGANRNWIGRDRMPELPGDWAGHIVQWDGDTKQQKTSWLVSGQFLRNHIESSSQFFCLQKSHPGPVKLPAATLDQLVDQRHQPVSECADRPNQLNSEVAAPASPTTLAPLPQLPLTTLATLATLPPAKPQPPVGSANTPATTATQPQPAGSAGNGSGDGGAASTPPTTATTAAPTTTTTTTTAAPPPPPPRTYSEQQGSYGANTFRNYHNASDMGPRIEPYQWVEVSCKVYDPTIQSANPDGYWYRIASSPWNNQYYAVANTFWNGDVPGQKPYTHNTDFNVPDC